MDSFTLTTLTILLFFSLIGLSKTDEVPRSTTQGTPVDYELWLWVTCGIAGGVILALVLMIIYCTTRNNQLDKKLRDQALELKVMTFGSTNKAIISGEVATISNPVIPNNNNAVPVQNANANPPAYTSPAVRKENEIISPRPTQQPRTLSPDLPEQRPRRESRDKPREERRRHISPDEVPSRKVQQTRYDMEMRKYQRAGMKPAPVDIETASSKLPRPQYTDENRKPKKARSIPDMDKIDEDEDFGGQLRANQGFSYLTPAKPISKQFPLGQPSSFNRGREEYPPKERRPRAQSPGYDMSRIRDRNDEWDDPRFAYRNSRP